jgi:hypothetical protein
MNFFFLPHGISCKLCSFLVFGETLQRNMVSSTFDFDLEGKIHTVEHFVADIPTLQQSRER